MNSLYGFIKQAVIRALLLGVVLSGFLQDSLAAQTMRVVASIPPLHGLVAKIMHGVAIPELLLKAEMSPHTFYPTPSDMEKISNADVLFWIGPGLEVGLNGLLSSREAKNAYAVIKAPGLHILSLRADADFEAHDHAHDHSHAHHCHDHAHDHAHHQDENDQGSLIHGHSVLTEDPHIWLDPHNAKAILLFVFNTLVEKDPAHQSLYRKNYERALQDIDALKEDIEKDVQQIKALPFIVFHDGYQYFEKAFALNGVGSFVLEVEAQVSLKRVRMLEEKIRVKEARCIFSEPQFSKEMLKRIAEKNKISIGVLDYMGVNISPGPDAYEQMMRKLAQNYKECLDGGTSKENL